MGIAIVSYSIIFQTLCFFINKLVVNYEYTRTDEDNFRRSAGIRLRSYVRPSAVGAFFSPSKFTLKTKTMKKVSFTFPDYNSIWSFKEKTKAINVRVEPKRNVVTGLFHPLEIEMAVKEFRATERPQ